MKFHYVKFINLPTSYARYANQLFFANGRFFHSGSHMEYFVKIVIAMYINSYQSIGLCERVAAGFGGLKHALVYVSLALQGRSIPVPINSSE